MNELENLSNTEIKAEWRKYYKKEVPQHARRHFLLKHIEWQRDAKKYGGLSAKSKNQLARLMQSLRDGRELIPPTDLNIKSGTKLLREYKGAKHEVIVAEGRYVYQGRQYKSLSHIARDITGTRWNGKVFFGVKQ